MDKFAKIAALEDDIEECTHSLGLLWDAYVEHKLESEEYHRRARILRNIRHQKRDEIRVLTLPAR